MERSCLFAFFSSALPFIMYKYVNTDTDVALSKPNCRYIGLSTKILKKKKNGFSCRNSSSIGIDSTCLVCSRGQKCICQDTKRVLL